MAESLIIGYGVALDDAGRVLLLHRRDHESLWPGRWWLPGDVTPLSEEPDATVPRLFEHLLRQRVHAIYAHTVTGSEPSSGRHVVHNAYLVTVEQALDGAPSNESNPFDAMEWWDPKAALEELPSEQSQLLAVVLERLASGWDFEAESSIDVLFDESAALLEPSTLADRNLALVQLAARVAASSALGGEPHVEPELAALRSHGWSTAAIEHACRVAGEIGGRTRLEFVSTNDGTN